MGLNEPAHIAWRQPDPGHLGRQFFFPIDREAQITGIKNWVVPSQLK